MEGDNERPGAPIKDADWGHIERRCSRNVTRPRLSTPAPLWHRSGEAPGVRRGNVC